jgi:hypothetical protein
MNLPNNINYKKYSRTAGMSTSYWGPNAWNFLFTSIIGNYPYKIDKKNKEHITLQEYYKNFLSSLEFVMPCIFCRKSFKKFIKQLAIEDFLGGRIELMYWLYLIKDKVNNKLIKQEKRCYINEKKRLKELLKKKEITKNYFDAKLQEFGEDTFRTTVSPPFKEILDKYENMRAECSPTTKSCRLPFQPKNKK